MQTRSDQAQAYRFVTRRIVSALLSGEPETAERPMRRFGMAVFGSIMLATIVFAVSGVLGFFIQSGVKLEANSIVIEKETGANFVYVDGVLYPVANFASARLVVRSDAPQIVRAPTKSLREYPRGPALGIPAAPDPLPDAKALTDGPWSVCSLPAESRSSTLETHVVIGNLRANGTMLGKDAGLLLEQTTTERVNRFLVVNGRRSPIDQLALTALSLRTVRGTPVTDSLIAAIPPGPVIAQPTIPDAGQPGPAVGGIPGLVGQVYESAGQSYVLLGDGLSPIGDVMRRVLLASGGEPEGVSATDANEALSPRKEPFDAGFPQVVPTMQFADAPAEQVCAVSRDPGNPDNDDMTVRAYQRAPDTSRLPAAPGAKQNGPDGVRLADAVDMVPGTAALVRVQPSPGDRTLVTTTYLVTDQGLKYAFQTEAVDKIGEIQVWLGYGGIVPVPVPQPLLSLLAPGPVLDPFVASSSMYGGGPGLNSPAPTPDQPVPAGPADPAAPGG
jgi:type VII secretion protein EccB